MSQFGCDPTHVVIVEMGKPKENEIGGFEPLHICVAPYRAFVLAQSEWRGEGSEKNAAVAFDGVARIEALPPRRIDRRRRIVAKFARRIFRQIVADQALAP